MIIADAIRKNNNNNQKALNIKSDFFIASTFIVINAIKKIINTKPISFS